LRVFNFAIFNLNADEQGDLIEVFREDWNEYIKEPAMAYYSMTYPGIIRGRHRNLKNQIEDRPGHDQRYAVATDKIEALAWQPEWPSRTGWPRRLRTISNSPRFRRRSLEHADLIEVPFHVGMEVGERWAEHLSSVC
jgi:dTDP-D-glucose 4,6-dehydratase